MTPKNAADLAKERIALLRQKGRQPARIARLVLQQTSVHDIPIEQLNLTRIELDAVERLARRLLGQPKRSGDGSLHHIGELIELLRETLGAG
jgi:predicted component of type VI protein secretion system